MYSNKTKNKKGFTLAEILVTLGIIGVIASMTIPNLVQDIQESQWKIAYKKAFGIASQAWKLALTNNEIAIRTSTTGNTAHNTNYAAFKSKFNVVKDCNSNNISECWDMSGEKWGSGLWPITSSPAFIDNSGMAWTMPLGAGDFLVDTNGFKGPNKYGRDRFNLFPVTVDNQITGMPVKLSPYPGGDQISIGTYCLSGNCYYVSWLKQ